MNNITALTALLRNELVQGTRKDRQEIVGGLRVLLAFSDALDVLDGSVTLTAKRKETLRMRVRSVLAENTLSLNGIVTSRFQTKDKAVIAELLAEMVASGEVVERPTSRTTKYELIN